MCECSNSISLDSQIISGLFIHCISVTRRVLIIIFLKSLYQIHYRRYKQQNLFLTGRSSRENRIGATPRRDVARKNALARVGTGDASGATKAENQKNCDGLTRSWMLQRWLDFPPTRCIFDFASLSYPFFTRSACRDDGDGPLRVSLGARSTLLLSVSMSSRTN